MINIKCRVLSAPGLVHAIALPIKNKRIVNSARNKITDAIKKNRANAESTPRRIDFVVSSL